MTIYLSVDQVLRLHEHQIAAFGGADAAAKAAALMHSLVMNHPFVDGNKRVGAMAMELFLLVNSLELHAADEEIEAVTMGLARGEVETESLAIWLRQRCRPIEA